MTCSTPYVKDQTFENHNEEGDWMCRDCWIAEAFAGCLKTDTMVSNLKMKLADETEADDTLL